jgi:FdhE protein
MKPSLHTWTAALSPQVDLSAWMHGSCPFCGSLPALAVLRGPQRARYLRCAMCGAEWPFNRLQCAGCESSDARSLGLMWVDGGAESQSVQTCESCHSYLKMLTILEPFSTSLLPVLDLETIRLDLLASQRGYHRTA